MQLPKKLESTPARMDYVNTIQMMIIDTMIHHELNINTDIHVT